MAQSSCTIYVHAGMLLWPVRVPRRPTPNVLARGALPSILLSLLTALVTVAVATAPIDTTLVARELVHYILGHYMFSGVFFLPLVNDAFVSFIVT